ncbi:putative One cut domain family member 2 [Trichinella spiralis]|uniref:putative One cut domain family member 2 n=1 Tax=Trichinella spiralis TaxID=6334 RepID=UPI0001EFD8C5|nr:putative One cut domain family member 2 [Trichinella spiralis]
MILLLSGKTTTGSASAHHHHSHNGAASNGIAYYLEEINTKELAQRISAELRRYSIPQAIFAQRVLCRSQGTLSDLLRNPKPWSKLKSGRETFRRMLKWLQEPEFQRMSALRLTVILFVLRDLVGNQSYTVNATEAAATVHMACLTAQCEQQTHKTHWKSALTSRPK